MGLTLGSLDASLSKFSSIILVMALFLLHLYVVRTLGLTFFSSRILISNRLRTYLISSMQLIRRIQLAMLEAFVH